MTMKDQGHKVFRAGDISYSFHVTIVYYSHTSQIPVIKVNCYATINEVYAQEPELISESCGKVFRHLVASQIQIPEYNRCVSNSSQDFLWIKCYQHCHKTLFLTL